MVAEPLVLWNGLRWKWRTAHKNAPDGRGLVAGLNALTPAQQAVLRTLKQHDLLEVAWDADRYYLEDPLQEAGEALRNNIGAFGPGRVQPIDHLRQRQRTVEVINLPNAIAQVHWAATELSALNEEDRSRRWS